jgi:hypothetical protein
MPYARSRARREFEADADRCIDVIRRAQRMRIRDHEVKDYILVAAIVHCSARIEAYLEDLITDWITALNTTPQTTHSLPAALRVRQFISDPLMETIKRFVVFDNEGEHAASLEQLVGTNPMVFAVDGQISPALDAGKVYHGKKFPSPKNMKALFSRMGVQGIFSQLNRSAGRDMMFLLQSFNDVRNEFAHEGAGIGLNANDIKRKIADAVLFVSHLDRVMYRHIAASSGTQFWTA